MHLMTSTRCGVSAKQLERELGVTYKTAWRMFTLIRNKLMTEDDEPLSGDVEVDETSVDGKPAARHHARTDPKPGRRLTKLRERSRATVFAAVERGGRVKATVLPSRSRARQIHGRSSNGSSPRPSSTPTNGPPTTRLHQHFAAHSRVRHSSGEYVVGDGAHEHDRRVLRAPQAVDPWELPKVSHKWLQGYLNEFTWRYNHRSDSEAMFKTLLSPAAALTRELWPCGLGLRSLLEVREEVTTRWHRNGQTLRRLLRRLVGSSAPLASTSKGRAWRTPPRSQVAAKSRGAG